ncbi:hypothetical protein CHS0354_027481 [Potamilus streckersoni]|uniref:G-protein coupled receptors family 1 profile domain-containing protein n=1 Tax=Potamilus streckersoni TaxID=2493646 RepID=A0AAE0S4P5_9BIVA|nr:hypothetical protein CHS0354_027481 [Potamilus streckersoni]
MSVYKFRRLQMPTNFFVTSLAVTDLVTACALPFFIAIEIVDRKVVQVLICISPSRVVMTAGGVSIMILAIIAYDRHTAVMNPLEYIRLMTKKKVLILVVTTWLYSGLIAWIPVILGWYETKEYKSEHCSSEIVNRKAQILFIGAVFTPSCLVIIFCYARIYKVARHHARAIAAVEASLRENLEMQFIKKDTKYAKTIAVVIGVFIFLWLPCQIFLLAESIDANFQNHWVRTYLYLLAICNSGLNPWVYTYQNSEFRAAYRKILDSSKCKRRSSDKNEDRRTSIMSDISSMANIRLSRASSRVLASDIIYVLSRQMGQERIQEALSRRLSTKDTAISVVCSLPDILQMYAQNNQQELLQQTIKEESDCDSDYGTSDTIGRVLGEENDEQMTVADVQVENKETSA